MSYTHITSTYHNHTHIVPTQPLPTTHIHTYLLYTHTHTHTPPLHTYLVHIQSGLDKLAEAEQQVATLSSDAASQQVLLTKKQAEVALAMDNISKAMEKV